MAKPAFAPNAQVEHGKFGFGSVVECTDEHVKINFDEHGEKKFVLSIVIANLKKSDRQAPAGKKKTTRKKAVPAVVPAAAAAV